jgi:Lrp/AsnC family transcriptional regulator for asnA, asnC and gidA
MDSLDKKIIQELTQDGRTPFQTIAKKLGVSTQTIIRRHDEMKANGTIALSAVRLNLQKMGYQGTVHVLIIMNPGANSSETVEQLRKTPNVIIATRTIGSYEAYAIIAFKDVDDLYKSIIRIRELPNVLTTDVSFGIPGIQFFPPETRKFNLPENENP